MTTNIKDIFNKINNAKSSLDELEDIATNLDCDLNELVDFVSNLVENTREDNLHLSNVKRLRKTLTRVNDTLLLIFNNLEIETAIPKDTTGSKI